MRKMLRQPSGDRRPGEVRHPAFNLVELITVVAILGIVLGVVIPGASGLWTQKNEAATENLVRGLLASARVQAIQAGERGLFFYLDDEGVQRAVFIEAEPPKHLPTNRQVSIGTSQDERDCEATFNNPDCICDQNAVNRFRVLPGRIYTVPVPYRVLPAWAVELAVPEALPTSANYLFPRYVNELAEVRFRDASGVRTPRYHRNFFAVVFNREGHLLIGRNVLIHDPDTENGNAGDGFGDVTGLPVQAQVEDYWLADTNAPLDFPTCDGGSQFNVLFDLIVLDDLSAANFQSTDTLAVYDDSAVSDLNQRPTLLQVQGGDPTLVQLLGRQIIENGQLFYVNRYTGDIILGPRGGGGG